MTRAGFNVVRIADWDWKIQPLPGVEGESESGRLTTGLITLSAKFTQWGQESWTLETGRLLEASPLSRRTPAPDQENVW